MAGQFRAAVEKFCANGKKIHDHRAARSAVGGGVCVQNGSRERAANDLHKSRMAHTCKTVHHTVDGGKRWKNIWNSNASKTHRYTQPHLLLLPTLGRGCVQFI